MNKPRLRKGLATSYRCAWKPRPWTVDSGWWYTFGETMEVAYEKMAARADLLGVEFYGPYTAG